MPAEGGKAEQVTRQGGGEPQLGPGRSDAVTLPSVEARRGVERAGEHGMALTA